MAGESSDDLTSRAHFRELAGSQAPAAPETMNTRILISVPAAILGLSLLGTSTASAGRMIAPPDKSKIVEPVVDSLPPGTITAGGKFSDHLQSGFIDTVLPFWGPRDVTLFASARGTWADNSQSLGSVGLGMRYLIPDREIIVGANVFYDSIDSQYGNHFDQLGIGLEFLSRWFDARVNWYLPDDSTYTSESSTATSKRQRSGGTFVEDGLIKQRFTEIEDRVFFKRYESALEGFNLEGGFLVPGVDRYFELRLLAGYYRYTGAFGQRYEGFKARAEARFLPGVIGDLEYWDDQALVGGHWVAGVRVSVPFSVGNLFTGRNPFEGAGEMFKPRKREFRERLSEMVIRSHRVMTSNSGPQLVSKETNSESSDKIIGTVPPPPVTEPPFEEPPFEEGPFEEGRPQ